MSQDLKPKLPIGYWIKQADNLLTEQINKAQSAHGVSRSGWQILNLLNETGGASKEQVLETMRTFVDASTVTETMDHFREHGWVERKMNPALGAEEFHLTEEGGRQYQVVFTTQKQIRQRAMQGISEEEYATAIRVLQRIVNNLGGERKGPAWLDSSITDLMTLRPAQWHFE